MMMQEFIERTGFEPLFDEYKEIEEAYYSFNGNKDEFCADWMKNGGPEKIAEARAKKIEQLDSRILELDRQLRQTTEQYEKRIDRLNTELEREQEWKLYEDKDNYQQDRYDELRSAGRVMTDEEAKDLLYDWYGFAKEKITIHHSVPKYEVNRHRQLRKIGETERLPLYEATDWNYIRFDCGCLCYELVNDQLRPYLH